MSDSADHSQLLERPPSAASPNEQVDLGPFKNGRDHLWAGLGLVELRVRGALERGYHKRRGLDWDAPFRGLYLTDAMVAELLDRPAGTSFWQQAPSPSVDLNDPWGQAVQNASATWRARTQLTRSCEPEIVMPLNRVAERFELTQKEVEMLLLAVAPELDQRYEQLYGFLNDDVTKRRPTVDLLLSLMSDDPTEKLSLRHALLSTGRLIQNRLLILNTQNDNRPPFPSRIVQPAESVVNFLTGYSTLCAPLQRAATLLSPEACQGASGAQFAPSFLSQLAVAAAHRPIFSFLGGYGAGKREAAAYLAGHTGQGLIILDVALLHQTADSQVGLENGIRLALRESRLHHTILVLTQIDSILEEHQLPAPILSMIQTHPGTVILSGEKMWQYRDQSAESRPCFVVQFEASGYVERLSAWTRYAQREAEPFDLAALANHFKFTNGQIRDAVKSAADVAVWEDRPLRTADLLEASRSHSNQNLAELAQKVTISVGWPDLILPQDRLTQLKELTNQARNRPIVHDRWGFGAKLSGRGISALFTGEPGTGKTMSAAIIAGDLGLDLYKVDLSTLVSKYIGETEKNLDKLFTEANTSNAVLFFDEADSIFGKRSEVKDSHDRYANLEISYLLQRIESYDGIAILATNMRANLDEAFTRRFDFITEFPFPDESYRAKIWQIHFPSATPLAADIDIPLLAKRFRLAGGNIRKIVLSAAFLAAQEEVPIDMGHMMRAVRREYQKIGRLIEEELFKTGSEVR